MTCYDFRRYVKCLWIVALASLLGPMPVAAQSSGEKLARPTPEQAAWHDCEIGMFLCLDPCTWQDLEYDDHSTPLEKINPAKLDTDQWVATAEAMGAKYIVFVAKHTGGFCWWQTETTDYGVRNTPWRDGKGDVMKDLAESCRKRGMKLGVYLSPADAKFGAGGVGRCKTPEAQQRYDKIFRQQLTELLSRYGEMFEVWFDGSSITDVGDILKQYCPKAMIFQGPYATIRWVGNEDGVAPYPNWNSLPLARAKSGVSTGPEGNPDGDAWLPNECDARIRSTWFWNTKNANTLKSVDQLMSMYYQSVGRGAVLLLNMTPDTTGLMPVADVRRAEEFGAEIRRRFGKSIAETSGRGELVELDLGRPTRIDHVVTMENILGGERVREYVVEGLADGQWQELCRGSSIGHKKIDQFAPTEVSKIRLRVVKSAAEPRIRKLTAYAVDDAPKTAAPAAADLAQKVWEWSAETTGKEWKTVNIDLTPYCKDACVYQVDFESTSGSPLEIQSLQYVFDGTVLPEFVRKASADTARYYVTVTGLGKPLGLQLVVRTSGAKKDSRGIVTIRKCPPGSDGNTEAGPRVLKAESFKHYVDTFNKNDRETLVNAIPNASAWSWMADNVPRFECPDKQMEETYLFPLVGLSETHQADPGRVCGDRVPASGRLGKSLQHHQLRRGPSYLRRPMASRSEIHGRLRDVLLQRQRQSRRRGQGLQQLAGRRRLRAFSGRRQQGLGG